MKYFCNPLNIEYKYQFLERENEIFANREAADPSLVLFKGIYYLFPSMMAGFLCSDDLVSWTFHSFKQEMPIYDYAPDVRVIGKYLYFSASKSFMNCSFFRTTDPINGEFEEIEGKFPFFDPNLFEDEDGRVFFYWGCSNREPIYGIEMDPVIMIPIGDKVPLIKGNEAEIGFERTGDDHVLPLSAEEIEQKTKDFYQQNPETPESYRDIIFHMMGNAPYIEGPWVDKHNGIYYLQYAAPGSHYNTYGDGVYISESPLGPYKLAKNNPYSYKPGGFITGAGHGSTVKATNGQHWHIATMRLSKNHHFERRLGLWQAGFDQDGELFCDQRYGDWPLRIDQKPWEKPDWMLLSYNKPVISSEGEKTDFVTDENIQTWWTAKDSNPGKWLQVDLQKAYDVRAIQINFSDWDLKVNLKEHQKFAGENSAYRYIDEVKQETQWILEGSLDGSNYFMIEDKSASASDYSHDFIVRKDGLMVQFLRLSIINLPYKQVPKVSGIRVFGMNRGEKPLKAKNVKVIRQGELDMEVFWKMSDATGYNILWGHEPEKLYHSYMVFDKDSQKIGALVKGQDVFVRVDSFNEVGITEGDVIKI